MRILGDATCPGGRALSAMWQVNGSRSGNASSRNGVSLSPHRKMNETRFALSAKPEQERTGQTGKGDEHTVRLGGTFTKYRCPND